KHGINEKPRKFSEALFKKDTELLFSKVTTQPLEEKQYIINIQMKKEDLKKFHTFLDTLSLKYYVQINDDLEFTTEDEIVNAKITLETL
ncbi:MAG: Unknown protein, partial [uncultured Sulfurovum sp.]